MALWQRVLCPRSLQAFKTIEETNEPGPGKWDLVVGGGSNSEITNKLIINTEAFLILHGSVHSVEFPVT